MHLIFWIWLSSEKCNSSHNKTIPVGDNLNIHPKIHHGVNNQTKITASQVDGETTDGEIKKICYLIFLF
jgi:hypothetical protein